jgi:hypothetical protein
VERQGPKWPKYAKNLSFWAKNVLFVAFLALFEAQLLVALKEPA